MLTFKATYEGTGPTITSHNPATGEPLGQVRSFTTEEAKAAIERARAAQKTWAEKSLNERITYMRRFQHLLTEQADDVCRLISQENGKPLQEAMETEVMPIIDLTSYFCNNAKRILSDQRIPLHLLKYRRSYLTYRPRGLMLIISPWNFPFTIPSGAIVMGLIAGNAVIQKPASLTPLIALRTQEIFTEAGLDPDLFQVVPGPGVLGSRMIEMGVDYVNFTGSTAVGLRVAELCGRLLIPCSMELGGKDPAIVCDDANLDMAAGSIVWGGLANAGQVCASVERVYAHEKIYDALVEKVVERTKKLRVGDPSMGDVDMGPMVDPNQLKIVEHQVNDALSHGAKPLVGGKRIESPGNFFEPTVLVDVTDDMEVIRDETFGPVIPIMKYADDDEAVERSNNSEYGLNAYVYSTDRERARRIARKLEAGTVMINETLLTHGCPELPWQGCKKSGLGKVHSDQGLRDLCYPYHINEDTVLQPPASPFWQPYSGWMYNALLASVKALYGRGVGGRIDGLKQFFNKPNASVPTQPEVND